MDETAASANTAAESPAPADAGSTTPADASDAPSAPASVPQSVPGTVEMTSDTTSVAGDGTTATTEVPGGPDALTKLDDDEGAFLLGALPLALIVVFGLAAVALFFYRRQKTWNDLNDELRIDDGDKPLGSGASHFVTRDLEEMDSTRPSQRMTELKDQQ